MYTRILGIATTMLGSASVLALSVGCVSGQRAGPRVAEARHDRAYVMSHQEAPTYNHYDGYRDDGYRQDAYRNDDYRRTVHVSGPLSQVGTESVWPTVDGRTTVPVDTRVDTGIRAEDRVTVVSEEKPPLTPVETPSRTPGANEFWVGGHWILIGNGFTWRPGRIESDRSGALFVPAGWANSPRGWEFTPEYWR